MREERRLYFDAAGARLRESRSVFDLHTGKPGKSANYLRQDVPIYRSLKASTALFPR